MGCDNSPLRFVECNDPCDKPYITSNTPCDLMPVLTDCSTSSRSSSSKCYSSRKACKREVCYDNTAVVCFKSMLLNLNNVTTDGQINNAVTFEIRKNNNVVTVQWPAFNAVTAVNGGSYFAVAQSIRNMPKYAIKQPYSIKIGSNTRWSNVVIDPSAGNQIKFYYTVDSDAVNINTVIEVAGGCIHWIC